MTKLDWYNSVGWDTEPLLTLRVVRDDGSSLDLGWLLDNDNGNWEYVHAAQDIQNVVVMRGLSLGRAKAAVEAMVQLRCNPSAQLEATTKRPFRRAQSKG